MNTLSINIFNEEKENIREQLVTKIVFENQITKGGKSLGDGVQYFIEETDKNVPIYQHAEVITKEKIMHIQANGNIKPDRNKIDYLFAEMDSVIEICFNNVFKTDEVTLAKRLFCCCISLKAVDVENLNLKKCTNVNRMFRRCESLERVTLKNLDSVTDARFIFDECKSLIDVNLAESNLLNLRLAAGMFYNCISLKEIDLSSIPFDKCYETLYMFCYAKNLESIKFSKDLNLERVIDASRMFYSCERLKKIDLYSTNLRDIQTLDSFAENCHSLEVINLRCSSDSPSQTSLKYFSENCPNLEIIYFADFRNIEAKEIERFAAGCTNLKFVELAQLKIAKDNYPRSMFNECKSLREVNADSDFFARGNNNFSGCKSIISLDLRWIRDTACLVAALNHINTYSALKECYVTEETLKFIEIYKRAREENAIRLQKINFVVRN